MGVSSTPTQPNGGYATLAALPVTGIPLPVQQALLIQKMLANAAQKQEAHSATVPVGDYSDQQRIRPQQIAEDGFWNNPMFHTLRAGLVGDAKKAIGQAPANPLETPGQQLTMLGTLYQRFDETGRKHLKALLNSGKLLANQGGEDSHSMLYHLYAMVTTPRLPGMDGLRSAQDTARLVAEPEKIVQTFVKLLPRDQQELLQRFQMNPVDLPPGHSGITAEQLRNAFSADCVPASIMVRQAMQHPDELARQINELTGLGYFYETARDWELYAKDPSKAESIIQQWQWQATPLGTDATGAKMYRLKFAMPESVRLRTELAHRRNNPGHEESPVESAYQGTLAYQGSGKRYNGLLALRWDESNQLSPGLNDVEKTVLESAMVDGKAIRSVPYMVATGRQSDAQQGNTQESYLFGYTTRFEDTLAHLTMALGMGWNPIIGFIETDPMTGRVLMGHEVSLVDYAIQGNEVYFKVMDTDDGVPSEVWRSAKELVPKLHHVGYPAGFAQRIQQDIDAHRGQYYRPDVSDRRFFTPIALSKFQPMDGWQDMIWEPVAEAPVPSKPVEVPENRPFPAPVNPRVYTAPPTVQTYLIPERSPRLTHTANATISMGQPLPTPPVANAFNPSVWVPSSITSMPGALVAPTVSNSVGVWPSAWVLPTASPQSSSVDLMAPWSPLPTPQQLLRPLV
ncbi:MAG: hypothetical protein U0003_02830 [Vampirovibrionales bacterium]